MAPLAPEVPAPGPADEVPRAQEPLISQALVTTPPLLLLRLWPQVLLLPLPPWSASFQIWPGCGKISWAQTRAW